MMLEAILKEVDEKMGEQHLKVTPEKYKKFIDSLLPWLLVECEPLIGASKAVLGKKTFKEYKIGLEYYHPKPGEDGLVFMPIDVGSVSFKNTQKNREISITCSIRRCNVLRHRNEPSSFNVELGISGSNEKYAFQELYRNYRRPIQKLLDESKVEFFTSYCSDIIDSYKGNIPSKKLENYFTDPDADNCFSLSKNFISTADATELMRVFLLFSALLHSCNGYMDKRKNIDRFESYIKKLS